MFSPSRRNSKRNPSAKALRRGQRRRMIETLEDRRLLTTYNVTTFLDRLDPSVTAVHPFATADHKLSLREAIQLANTHVGADTINLQKGTYKITIGGAGEDFNKSGDLDIADDVTIKGDSKGGTVINAAAQDRVFDI